MDLTQDQFGALSNSIEACGVAFRLRPSFVSAAAGPLEASFELDLRGLHDCKFEHVLAACVACRHLLFTLLDIADWVVPRGDGVNGAEEQHRHVTQYSRIFRECPETILIIKITRVTTLDDIGDGWISRYRDHLSSVLRELGCRELDWGSERRDQDTWDSNLELSYVAVNGSAAGIRRII